MPRDGALTLPGGGRSSRFFTARHRKAMEDFAMTDEPWRGVAL